MSCLLRRDKLKNWEKYNPILEEGEPAYITDLETIKIGNGKKRFKDLPLICTTFDKAVIAGASERIIFK